MRLALNMAKMVEGGFSRGAIKKTQYLIATPRTEIWEEKKQGVEFPGHKKVKSAIERHLAMLHQNHMPGCLPWQNGTARNPQTHWRCNGTGVPPPIRRRQQTPEPTTEPTPHVPETTPAWTGTTSSAQFLEIINLPARYAHSHTSLPCAQAFTLHKSAPDSKHDTNFDSDMLPDDGISSG